MRKLLIFMGFWVVMLVVASFMTACGKQYKEAEEEPIVKFESRRRIPKVEPDSMTYEFNLPECTTGRHVYRYKAEYCDALLDDSLNRYCARNRRLKAYRLRCDTYYH